MLAHDLLPHVLSCKHIHAWCAHEHGAQVTHVLRLPNYVLRNSEDYSIGHHLILVLLLHQLLGGCLLTLSELVVGSLIHSDIICLSKHFHSLQTGDADNSVAIRVCSHTVLLDKSLTIGLLLADSGLVSSNLVYIDA